MALAWQPYLGAGRSPSAADLALAATVAALGFFAGDARNGP